MSGFTSRRFLRRLGGGLSMLSVASAGAYVSAAMHPAAAQQKAPDSKPALAKAVYEQQLTIGQPHVTAFCEWLLAGCADALKQPGFMGAKLLRSTPPAANTPLVLFVLGGPGAGKGTQCARIVAEHGYIHLSAGDLLRAARQAGSSEGQLIDEYIREGRIVPVEITVALLRKAMAASGGSRFLIDGFPRNGDNLAGWHSQMGEVAHVGGVLMYDCAEAVMEARLLERGKTSGRADDNAAAIKKRFATYRAETMPVVGYYAQLGLVHTIDGSQPVEDVYDKTQQALAAVHKADALRRAQVQVVAHLYAADRASLERWLASPAGKAHEAAVRERAASMDGASRASGAVRSRVLDVSTSLKPYGLDSLRAFD